MSYIYKQHWNKKIVVAYLEDAADIHRRLPRVKVDGYYNLWPETMRDEWTKLYDAVNGTNQLGAPNAREVSYHEEIMEWLRWVQPDQQQLVWMRANRIPWKILIDQFGASKATLWRKVDNGLARIESTLIANQG